MLPEEPKDIRAIYVSDMARAPSWEQPGANNWVDAKQALFVVGSRVKGGMGADEAVPFSNREAADKFAAENGGRVMRFAEVPRDYVLGTGAETTSSVSEPEPAVRNAGHKHCTEDCDMIHSVTRRRVIGITAAAAGLSLVPLGRAGRAEASLVTWRGHAMGALASLQIHHTDRHSAERLVQRAVSEVRRLERTPQPLS